MFIFLPLEVVNPNKVTVTKRTKKVFRNTCKSILFRKIRNNDDKKFSYFLSGKNLLSFLPNLCLSILIFIGINIIKQNAHTITISQNVKAQI